MKIETIRLYQVSLPIAGAGYQLSRGRLITETLNSRQMRNFCLAAGCAMFVQEVVSAEMTHAATTHLAHTIPPPLLLSASTIKVAKSLADGAPVPSNGRCNGSPGLGIVVKTNTLGKPVTVFT